MDNNDKKKQMGNNSTPSRSKGRIFGLWPKRSTKVEPQPIKTSDTINNSIDKQTNNNENDDDDQNKIKQNNDSNKLITFARCSPLKQRIENQQQQQHNNENSSQNANVITSNKNNNRKINNSHHSNSKLKNPLSSQKKNLITFNNNRFSHQFHLCCSIDQKSQTPPVSVRYNSLPENVSFNQHNQLQHSNETITNNVVNKTTLETAAPLAEIECCSAPESPVSKNSHSSPSTTSVQSTQSDQLPRSIAITACKSRLRLKLLPPGKSIPNIANKERQAVDKFAANGDSITTKQHFSSPSILGNNKMMPDDPVANDKIENTRSMSHDGIQSIHRTSISSGDSLAKQALMAAQMLSLIPTEKARERNFMAGRLAVNPLLGANELAKVLPNKEVNIFVGTWNMNGQSPPKEMNDFILPTGIEHVPDIVAIGTQESCPERFEWEVTLQETLGPTHILFHSAYLGTIHLAIFLRRDLVWFCSVPEDASMSVRPGTAFRTKGAVAISFALFGTSMLFVTSHLTAHQQKVKERVQDVKRIIHALDLPRNLKLRHKNKDVTQNFDSVYWCGDLNFRLGEPREKLLEWIQTTKFPLPPHLPHGYMHTDQLSSVLADGAAFKGFMEAHIRFPPTYKYDPGTQHFDTSSKQRAPAYTDRILYKYRTSYLALRRVSHVSGSLNSQQPPPIKCVAYDSVPSIISSDHKPVWALFRNVIRPGVDTIPLAAGLFNREVYLEGMRRRLNSSVNGSSTVCSIQ